MLYAVVQLLRQFGKLEAAPALRSSVGARAKMASLAVKGRLPSSLTLAGLRREISTLMILI